LDEASNPFFLAESCARLAFHFSYIDANTPVRCPITNAGKIGANFYWVNYGSFKI
jgi:hypothetical protein